MFSAQGKIEIARRLQKEIDALQGLGRPMGRSVKMGLAPFESAFPEAVFPVGTVHEFISQEDTHAACTNAFISALMATFLKSDGYCMWIGRNRKVFPPALAQYGIQPHKVLFVDLHRQKDLLWAIEEALKCESLVAVVGELCELGFSESRRLQLAVERSGVTGFIHRHRPKSLHSTACTTRWNITPAKSVSIDGLPGVGYESWNIELQKVRNGKPGSWRLTWHKDRFCEPESLSHSQIDQQRNAG